MANLGPQIVQNSFGGLLKFETAGNTGITTGKLRITDGSGKETPLFLATASVHIESEFTASSDVVFSGLTQATQANIVCVDGNGRLYFQNSSSFQAPDDGDWTIGSSYMTASGQTSVYIPNRLENGLRNKAVGLQSHAEGADTIANGNYSHAEGRNTSASGAWSHAEGSETFAIGSYSHAEGFQTTAIGIASHAEGNKTYASNSSHAEGFQTSASFAYAHAEGQETKATAYASHAEGGNTLAKGNWSHAEGRNTSASGLWSHAEGSETFAIGRYSHAEGRQAEARGLGSHAAGDTTLALGDASYVNGYNTVADLDYQTVVGKYNIKTHNFDDVLVVGAGSQGNEVDGFKVRAPHGQVILNQEDTFGLLDPQTTSVADTLPGLYFGEPTSIGSVRIHSLNNSTYDNGTLYIQEHNGVGYSNMLVANNSSTTFIPA